MLLSIYLCCLVIIPYLINYFLHLSRWHVISDWPEDGWGKKWRVVIKHQIICLRGERNDILVGIFQVMVKEKMLDFEVKILLILLLTARRRMWALLTSWYQVDLLEHFHLQTAFITKLIIEWYLLTCCLIEFRVANNSNILLQNCMDFSSCYLAVYNPNFPNLALQLLWFCSIRLPKFQQ